MSDQRECLSHKEERAGSSIEVYGAREHNLKNIDAYVPHGSLTVITGLSGSGKSSLAFDTLFAEGQRRYIETFSAYARNFLGGMQRPDVDKVTGLSPVISIEQKTTNKNPRSTVGTITEVYDYLRLLFARAGEAYSYASGEKMVKYTEEQIIDLILQDYKGKPIFILAPLVKARKGHYRELFEQVRRKGFLYVRVDGEVQEVLHGMRLDRYKNHDIEVVVDKLKVDYKDDRRLRESVANAMVQGDGLIMILDKESGEVRHYSKRLMCPVTGLAYKEPAPHNFSFNSPHGFCHKCKGLGYVSQVDADKVFPDRTIYYFQNCSKKKQSAAIKKGSYIIDLYTGEKMPFNGIYEFAPCEALLVAEDGTETTGANDEQKKPKPLDGAWSVESTTPNVLPLDTCDYYFDGQLQEENGYVLNIAERANKLERALDICTFEEKKLVITGRDTGATCEAFGNYVMETLQSL